MLFGWTETIKLFQAGRAFVATVTIELIFDLRREAESNLSIANLLIGRRRRRLRTSDDNDLEHAMNTDSSLETCPFATFRPPQKFYYFFKLFFYIDE